LVANEEVNKKREQGQKAWGGEKSLGEKKRSRAASSAREEKAGAVHNVLLQSGGEGMEAGTESEDRKSGDRCVSPREPAGLRRCTSTRARAEEEKTTSNRSIDDH